MPTGWPFSLTPADNTTFSTVGFCDEHPAVNMGKRNRIPLIMIVADFLTMYVAIIDLFQDDFIKGLGGRFLEPWRHMAIDIESGADCY
jgi:hypothetical protein